MTLPIDRRILKLHAALSVNDFREAAGQLLESAVPHHSWECITDPLRFDRNLVHFRAKSGAVSDHTPNWDRSLELSPFRLFFQTHSPAKSVWLTSLWRDEDTCRGNRFFHEIMEPEGWRWGFAMGFWNNGSLRAIIGIRRESSRNDFTDGERSYLTGVFYPHVQVALMRVLKLEEERARRMGLECLLGSGEDSVILLDWKMTVLFASLSARGLCARWNDDEASDSQANGTQSFRLPRQVRLACVQFKFNYEQANQENGCVEPVEELEVLSSNGERLVARILGLSPPRGGAGKPMFQIRLSGLSVPSNEAASGAVALAARLLSAAEFKVAEAVCRGLSNREIAARLRKSPETVKKQLGVVFRKLGVSSRGRLASIFSQ